MSVLSFLSDAAWPILFLLFGLTMLFSPQDKVQETFPNVTSKKGLKIGGGVLVGIAIVYSILLVMDFLAM